MQHPSLLKLDQSINISSEIIQQITKNINREIANNQLLSHTNQYVCINSKKQILEAFNQMSIPTWKQQLKKKNQSLQQTQKAAIQSFIRGQIRCEKNIQFMKSKALSLRQQTKTSDFKSITKLKSNREQKSLQLQKQTVIKLQSDEEQVNDIRILRNQKEKQILDKLSREKQILERKRKREQKIEKLKNRNDYTFDFNGELVNTKQEPFSNLNINFIKFNANKFQKINQSKQTKIQSRTIEQKFQKSYNNPKYVSEQRDQLNQNSMTFYQNIPQFTKDKPSKQNPKIFLNQYRRKYANRYSMKSQKQSQLFDPKLKFSQIQKQKQQNFDFSKDIKKSVQVKKVDYERTYNETKSKFTLPKLNGRYDVLDRYKGLSQRSCVISTIE